MSLVDFTKEVGQSVCIMEHAGFKARLMRAERLVDNGCVNGLPPGQAINVFPIANLPGCPDSWVREAGTYVVPVSCEWGLWFDWTMNDALNTAVLPSVKGMNPITGQKVESLKLEEYSDKCPIHNVPFSHANLCPKCGYKWPPQNYITKDSGSLWWDGFKSPDGFVRQFFFSEEEDRDVASAVIGKKNTVPAFGFAFYQPKNPRTEPQQTTSRGLMWSYDNSVGDSQNVYYGCSATNIDHSMLSCDNSTVDSLDFEIKTSCFSGVQGAVGPSGPSGPSASKGISKGISRGVSRGVSRGISDLRCKSAKTFSKSLKNKDVSIGGGAKINQDVKKDSLGVDGWREEPSAVIRLYFCFEEKFKEIVNKGGVLNLNSNPEGFLKGVKLG